jgi:hypothetical protein
VCYCGDCRAYSRHLGAEAATHDELGGAEFVATQAKYVSFTDGIQQLACLSLSERGLLRWYARCCGTAIGNTTRNWKLPYVGLVHTCLKADPASFERSFPRIQMRVNTGGAKRPPPGMAVKTMVALAGFMPRVMVSGINGTYRQTPFFTPPTGSPIVAVSVLSDAERARAYRAD